jgi:hypothetical protein
VGKTSLITAILEESQKTLLAGTNILIEPGDTLTETRIDSYKSQLRATLKKKNEFTPEVVKGSEVIFKYFLDMKVIRKQKFGKVVPVKTKLRLGILDYPGGWMEKDAPPEDREKWETCKEWMHESAILVIPVDSPVLMESVAGEESLYASQQLLIQNIATIAQTWAKYRCEAQDPGLLILAPVKCEDYFNDNGGIQKDASDELFYKVTHEYYDVVIRKVQQEASQSNLIKIEYHPVDTIGSVELMNAEWMDDGYGKKYLESKYIVRSHVTGEPFQPYGADAILQSICKHIIGLDQKKKRGIVASFLRWATGENKDIREALERISKASVKSNRKRIID